MNILCIAFRKKHLGKNKEFDVFEFEFSAYHILFLERRERKEQQQRSWWKEKFKMLQENGRQCDHRE